MSEPIQDALAGVLDRVAPAPIEGEPDFFAKIPASLLKNKEITAAELRALGGIDRCCRGRDHTDARDYQIAEESGLSLSTFQRCLKSLRCKGIILCIGRTCGRVIRIIFGCKVAKPPTPLKSEGSSPIPLPSKVRGVTLTGEGNSPQNRGQFPSSVGASSKGREETPKARSSSSSPEGGDTTTTAKTKTGGTPPTTSAPSPRTDSPVAAAYRAEAEIVAAEKARLDRQWDALPETDRAAFEAEVRRDHPMLAVFPPMFRSLCRAAMEGRPAPTSPALPAVANPLPAVEILPTDRQLGALADLVHADDPIMRFVARSMVTERGRDDLFIDRGPLEMGAAGSPLARTTGRSPDTVSIGRRQP